MADEQRDDELMWRRPPRAVAQIPHLTHRLREALESHLVTTHVCGPAVLHVGIGAARGLIPLLQAGFRVTGVDLEDRLAAVREVTADLPPSLQVELRAGDVAAPPVRADEFDAVLALGVLDRAQNWRDVVRAWARAVRRGGVLVFDVGSRDHQGGDSALPASSERSGIDIVELLNFAHVEGLTLKTVSPWGAFLGDERPDGWLHSLEQTHRWKRLLSWFAGDDAMLELGIFLELFVVPYLGPRAAGQMLVVIERNPDIDQTHDRLLQRFTTLDAALRQRDLVVLEGFLPVAGDELRRALAQLTKPSRARILVSQLYNHARAHGVVLDRFLPDETRAWCERVWRASRMDESLMELLDRWADLAETTSLQPGLVRMLGYPMARSILPRLPREQA